MSFTPDRKIIYDYIHHTLKIREISIPKILINNCHAHGCNMIIEVKLVKNKANYDYTVLWKEFEINQARARTIFSSSSRVRYKKEHEQ